MRREHALSWIFMISFFEVMYNVTFLSADWQRFFSKCLISYSPDGLGHT